MNVVFLTQAGALSALYGVAQAMERSAGLGRVGFYVTDSVHFETFCRAHPDLVSGRYELLKEWEILERAAALTPNLERLREQERRLGDPVLWNALVADRRVYLGRRATIEQDYPSRLSLERMMAVLQAAVTETEALFDRVQPDLVVGFICVTVGDYLGYLIARSRGVPLVNLRPTRVRNYFYGGEDVFEPSQRLRDAYEEILEKGARADLRLAVEAYLEETRGTHSMYEGVLPAAGPTAEKGGSPSWLATLRGRPRPHPFDSHHDPGLLHAAWLGRVKRPWRAWRIRSALRGRYVRPAQLGGLDYAFFPLHKEPEVTLLVYSRPCLNQIEVARGLARSLPVGMRLLVKEHPAAVGYCPLSYYRKLLNIPNLLLAPPQLPTRRLVENARLVTVISGSVGLEAAVMRKPVVVLGGAPFAFLPRSMLRWVREPDRLAAEISDLLAGHRHDEQALSAYLAAVMGSSVPVDFYSRLLGRRGVYRPGADPADPHSRLADYVVDRYRGLSTAKAH